ncbi:MAG TPA: DoxX family protein [Mycobacterium sp.]|nr:DoxX family protein [Mycobacterium sp.]
MTAALSAPRTYVGLAAFQAGDAVACSVPVKYIANSLETLGVPEKAHWVMTVVKAASVVGLLSVRRYPGLARLTTAMLTLYFVLAVGAHIRVRDRIVNTIPAASFLVTYAIMTAKGPTIE